MREIRRASALAIRTGAFYQLSHSDIGSMPKPLRDLVPGGDGSYLKAGSKHFFARNCAKGTNDG